MADFASLTFEILVLSNRMLTLLCLYIVKLIKI